MDKISCEIICVGTELLLGEILNTNAQYISEGLARIGIDVFYQTVVGDNPVRLGIAVETAIKRADIVITTGGLGPTCDDLTKETVAKSFDRKLMMDESCLRGIEEAFARTGRPMSFNNRKQAMMPEGAIVLANTQGTAPGCIIEGEAGKAAIMMPGPPREMRRMFDEQVVPYLRKYSDMALFSRVIRVIGLGESAMEEKVLDIIERSVNPTVAPYAKSGECLLRVTAKAHDEKEADSLLNPVVEEIKGRLGDFVYGIDVETIEAVTARLLQDRGKTVCLADSCTGGLAAKRLYDAFGSSGALRIAIAGCCKDGLPALLERVGRSSKAGHACSKESALEMAFELRDITGSDIGLAICRSEDEVDFAVTDRNAHAQGSYRFPAGRDRDYVNTIATNRLFDELRRFLEKMS